MNFGSQVLDFEDQSITGVAPYAIFESHGQDDSLADLRSQLQHGARQFPQGGAIGFFSYEAAKMLEPRAFSISRTDSLGLPLIRLVFYRELRSNNSVPPPQALHWPVIDEFPDFPAARDAYCEGVEVIRNYIAAGDIYQANLTQPFSFQTSFSASQIYQRLHQLGAAPRAALLQWNDFSIISNSPETFLTLKSGVLEAKPIKGTIARGVTPEKDEELKRELAQSAKNRAENVMIVDLLRNDLGRVCDFGSIEVPTLYQIETFPTLHHGVSTVRGRLRPDCDALDAFVAAFPCGSITGAPKIRAMQILSEIESRSRGASMGAIGYFGFNGDMDWSVAIRTATLIGDQAHFHVGGGIVADSQPESEYQEMRLKARALYWAIVNQG